MNLIFQWLLPCLLLFNTSQDPLSGYKWKNRILIISAPSETDRFKEQLQSFQNIENEITDRDLVIIKLIKDQGHIYKLDSLEKSLVRNIKKKFSIKRDKFALLLIGKDGTIKLRSDKYVPIKEVLDLIDSMPMRQSEIKRRDQR